MCTCPSKSWFSMKSWNASLLLSLLSSPPSLSARVLNGQYFLLWMGTNLTQFLMYKKLRLKESFVFLERRQPKKFFVVMLTPFRTLSSGTFAPSIPLHFSSFDKSLILSMRSTWASISWIFWKRSIAKYSAFGKIFHSSSNCFPKYKQNNFLTFWFPMDSSLVTVSLGTGLEAASVWWILSAQHHYQNTNNRA